MAHILLPTDFSDHSLHACEYAFDLFGSEGNAFTLVHSYVEALPGYATMVEMSPAAYADSVEDMAGFAERVRALKGAVGALVFTQVVNGALAAALAQFCAEKSIAYVVMGTQGAGGMNVFGSSAAAVARFSRVPVLIVPSGAHFTGLRSILFADDHQGVDPLALQPLVKLAQRFGAEITITHVLRGEDEEPDQQVVLDYDSVFSGLKHRYIGVPGDDAALTLSNVAERDQVAVVAVLHRHLGFLDSLLHQSTMQRLAMHSRIPLLVLEH